jgi:acyl-homoserine-lactone acylase
LKIVRTVAAFVTLFALSGAVLIAPSAVAKNPKVSVQVKTSNQAALNSSKGLMVMVKASGKTTVTVKATGDGKGNAFKSQKVKFGKKGSKSVKMALTSAGRTTMLACGSKQVKVTASFKGGKKAVGKTLPYAESLCKATIRWTEYGIPRIEAKDYRSLGYGYGYSLAEQNICSMADIYTTVRGERSKYFGPDLSYEGINNRDSDFFFRQAIAENKVGKLLASETDAPKPGVRAMVWGYVKGYNAWLRETGVDNIEDETCSGEAWVKQISENDAYQRFYQLSVYASANQVISKLVNAQPPGTGNRSTSGSAPVEDADALTGLDELALGSNAVGLGSESTATGKGMLFGNPHFPWQGQLRFFQSQLTIPGKLNVSGGSLLGSPVILIGHTEKLAWSHTVSTARRFAVIQSETSLSDPTTYFTPDGKTRKMTATKVKVEVKQEDGSIEEEERTLYSTIYGQVITGLPQSGAENLYPWSQGQVFSLIDPNAQSFRYLNHFFEANHAQKIEGNDGLEGILKRNQGVPWVNTIGADSTGKALYADVGVVPNIDDQKWTDCGLVAYGFVWNSAKIATLDGSKPGCAPANASGAVAPGILPNDKLPLQIRDDYTSNMNDSFWLSNPEAPITGIPSIVGNVDSARSLRTRNGLVQIAERLAGTDGQEGDKFTLPQVQNMLTSNTNYGASLLAPDMLAYCEVTPIMTPTSGPPVDVSGACEVLAEYDLTDRLDSAGALLWRRIAGRLPLSNAALYNIPFSLGDPVNTPAFLNTSNAAVQKAMADTVKEFAATTPVTPLDATLRDYQFVTRNGERIPIPGGPGGIGVYNAISASRNSTTGEYDNVTAGTSFVINASLDGSECPDVKTILSYSQAATNAASPNYSDQTELFSDYGWVEDRFCLSQQEADPSLRIENLNGGVTP